MTKKSFVFKKGLVIGIIILFIGASVVPCITGYDKDVETIENKTDDYNNLMSQVIESGVISRDDWNEQDKLLPSDGAAFDFFGGSVSIDGDYAIIGASDDDNGDASGSAYIFKRSGTTWTEQDKLLASDGAAFDFFGVSVSIDGDYAIIGAYGDADNGQDSGSAYIFTRSGTTWTEQAKLLPSDGTTDDFFGWSVSIDGDYAIIGACFDGDNGYESGSAYVFKRDGTTWTEQAKLLPSDGAAEDWFGFSVSIDGDYAIIGAPADDSNGYFSGSAYVFTRSGTNWNEQDKLLASDGAEGDLFGWSVSIDGGYAIIGASDDDDNGQDSGSAYIFTSVNSPPNEPSDPDPEDGETDVDVNQDLSWTCSDPDGDPLTYNVFFEADDTTPDVLVSENQSGTSYDPPGDLDFDTLYYWQIVAWDDNDASTEGPVWSFTTTDNNPPYEPSNPDPYDDETDVDVNRNLYWDCSDPDGDPLVYDVYFEADDSTPDVLVSYHQSQTYYNPPGQMEYNTHYYWQIVAWDDKDAYTPGSTWHFITGSEPNNPPDPPFNPIPVDDASGVNVTSVVFWNGTDPDGDSLVYDVYFEANDPYPDEQVSDDQTENTFDPGEMDKDMIYYWQIIAKDEHGASTPGPIWHFTTESPNEPPSAPIITGQTSGKPGTEYEYTFNAVDPDGDNVKYHIDWDDGDSEETGFNPSGTDVKVKHTWITQGTYIIKAKAEDTNGLESDWTELSVTMPRNRATQRPFLQFLQNFLQQYPILYQLLLRFLQL